MEITKVKIWPIDNGNLQAFGEFTVDDCLVIMDVRVIRSPTGYFISMPDKRKTDGSRQEVVRIITAETRQLIEDRILGEFEKVTGQLVKRRKRAH